MLKDQQLRDINPFEQFFSPLARLFTYASVVWLDDSIEKILNTVKQVKIKINRTFLPVL
jgi:hypothetical protein